MDDIRSTRPWFWILVAALAAVEGLGESNAELDAEQEELKVEVAELDKEVTKLQNQAE